MTELVHWYYAHKTPSVRMSDPPGVSNAGLQQQAFDRKEVTLCDASPSPIQLEKGALFI